MADPTPYDRIQAKREATGLSALELCRQAGLNKDTLAGAKRRGGTLDLPTIEAFAKFFGCPVSELLGEAPPAPPGSQLTTTTQDRIRRNPKNPRRLFDPASLDDMAASVAEKGILQPLLVRPDPTAPDTFELIAGERRWRGAGLAIERGMAAADMSIPIIVRPCDDREALKIAMTENLQRRDMTALEEAEGYAAMIEMGETPTTIEKALGVNRRTVQKRLRLVRDLTPQLRDSLAEGAITVETANVMAAYCPKSKQNATLAEIKSGRFTTTQQLKRTILQTRIPASAALFDLSAYGGDWIEDEDEPEERYFSDSAQFQSLQAKALKAKIAELEQIYPWVRQVDQANGESYDRWNYTEQRGHKKAGAIVVKKANGAAEIHLDQVADSDLREENQAETTPDKPAPPPEPTTKAHQSYAHRRKSEALQVAIAADPMAAVRLAIMGLLGSQYAVRIKAEMHPVGDDRCVSPAVAAILAGFIPRLQDASKDELIVSVEQGWLRTKSDPGYYSIYSMATWDSAALWQSLVALPDDDVMRLFAAIVALRSGSFDNYAPALGDNPAAQAIAETLGLVGNEATAGLTLQAGDLEGLRKDTLLSIARANGVREANKLKTADLKAQILDDLDPSYVLPTLRFGSEDNIKAMLAGKPHPAELKAAIERSNTLADEVVAYPPQVWDAEKKFAEVANHVREQIAEIDPPPGKMSLRFWLERGVNALQRRPLDRTIDLDRRFAPDDLAVNPATLIDDLFEICADPADYVAIKTFGDAVDFVDTKLNPADQAA